MKRRNKKITDEEIRDVHYLYNTTKLGCIKIAQIVGISATSVLEIKSGVITATPVRCPDCGRVSSPPCLVCYLRKRNYKASHDNEYYSLRIDLELKPDDYERYQKIRKMR